MGQDGPNDSESGPAVDIVEGSPVTPDGITLGQLGVLQILCAVPPGRFDWVSTHRTHAYHKPPLLIPPGSEG